MKNFLIKNKKYISSALVAIITFNFLFFPLPVSAGFGGWITSEIVLFVSGLISSLLGTLFGVVLWLEAQIIDYIINPANFSLTNSPIVNLGWGITRDLANMFLILILLFIAFATVLKIQSYAIKQLWWKVLVVALLINFSLVIAGLIIDFAQVLTVFFLNQITHGGSFATITTRLASSMQILNFYNPVNTDNGLPIIGGMMQFGGSAIAAIVGIILTLVGLIITVFVFGAATIFLIVRILYIWFLLIIMPIVCMLWILPATSKHFSQWWNTFLKWVFFAPIYVFMIYLSLSIFDSTGALKPNVLGVIPAAWNEPAKGLTTAVMPSAIFQWILVIALMFTSLIVAQKMGVEGAKGATKTLTDWGTGTKNWAGRQLRRGYVGATKTQASTPPPVGAGIWKNLKYGARKYVGAPLGKAALRAPILREQQLKLITKEDAAYKAIYEKYKGVSPTLLNQLIAGGMMDPRKKSAIQQLLIEKDVLKPGADNTLEFLDKLNGYGQGPNFLKTITEKLGKDGWKAEAGKGGFNAAVINSLFNRTEQNPELEQGLLKQLGEDSMKKNLTVANGYDKAARINLLQRSQKYGKEQDFLKFFPVLAEAIGKNVKETIKKIENATDIYEDQLVAEVVKELNSDQLKGLIRKGDDTKIKKVKDITDMQFDTLDSTIKTRITDEILNKTKEIIEIDKEGKEIKKQISINKEMRNSALRELAKENPDVEKIARNKFITTSPAWEI